MASSSPPTVASCRELLAKNAQLLSIKQLEGVLRVDIETYHLMGQKEERPIFVVVANSNFKDRDKVPRTIEGVGLIMSYEEAATEAEMKEEEEQREDESEEEGEEEDEEGESEEEEGEGEGDAMK